MCPTLYTTTIHTMRSRIFSQTKQEDAYHKHAHTLAFTRSAQLLMLLLACVSVRFVVCVFIGDEIRSGMLRFSPSHSDERVYLAHNFWYVHTSSYDSDTFLCRLNAAFDECALPAYVVFHWPTIKCGVSALRRTVTVRLRHGEQSHARCVVVSE